MTATYSVGIDLGTTHSALAYSKLDGGDGRSATLPIAQLVARGTVEARTLLPSFVYFAHESDGALALPWDAGRTFAVGAFARERAREAPARVVSSAKSWLSYAGVDRRAPLLPPGAPEDIEKISPVEASFRLLDHLGEAWAATFGDATPLSEQSIVLTVPASFDAAARDLTVEAAFAAGMNDVTLLEEPQAALYAFLEAVGDDHRRLLKPGDVVLVIDVGGGTTDFSAIEAVDASGSLELRRVAVGDHILLGGDNMDLALSHFLSSKLDGEGKSLDRFQLAALAHACREAKERLLETDLGELPVVVPARGSALLGGSLRTTLARDDVERIVVEGFFPRVRFDEEPARRPRAGLTTLGLPYAAEPAITRHLAAFLRRQAGALEHGSPKMLRPTAVLFNGGVLKAAGIRDRLLELLNGWLAADGAPPARALPAVDLDLAVARGACSYGLVRRGRGLRIKGGTARAYYVGIESAMPAVPGVAPPITALCVAPFGMEEGTVVEMPPHELGLVVGEPVRFRFFGSSVRRDDTAGTELERVDGTELEELAPIEITLPAEDRADGNVVPVRLESQVTAVGTLQLDAVPMSPRKPDERWKLELEVRGKP